MGRYYQILQVQESTTPKVNEVGDIVTTTKASWESVGMCRVQPNGKSSTVTTGNGDVKTYSSSIFAPTTCPDVAENAKVRVLDKDGQVVADGICQRFHRYIHYVKIWI